MGRLTEILSDQIITYRELLALSYVQKEVIQNGELDRVPGMIGQRQTLIQQARDGEQTIGQLLAARDADAQDRQFSDDEPDGLVRRLLSESAMLLEKLISLDKENERLLEMKTARS